MIYTLKDDQKEAISTGTVRDKDRDREEAEERDRQTDRKRHAPRGACSSKGSLRIMINYIQFQAKLSISDLALKNYQHKNCLLKNYQLKNCLIKNDDHKSCLPPVQLPIERQRPQKLPPEKLSPEKLSSLKLSQAKLTPENYNQKSYLHQKAIAVKTTTTLAL